MVKNPPANAGDTGLIPGLGRSTGEGNDNPLQYSCLDNLHRQRKPGRLQPIGWQRDMTEHARTHTHILAKCSPLAHSQAEWRNRKTPSLTEGGPGLPLYPCRAPEAPAPHETIFSCQQLPTVHVAQPASDGLAWLQRARRAVCSQQVGEVPSRCRPLCLVLPPPTRPYLPSGPAPSCPAGSQCPPPPSPPASEAHSPAPQTDSCCPCRSGRKQKPGVSPG